jgi:hypothetical protein
MRDEQLMNSFISYFDCGKMSKSRKIINFRVTRINDMVEKIIPFFDKNKIIGEKSKDFEDFKQIAFLMKNKAHNTPEGLEKIRQIQKGMNRGRSYALGA